jgi:hypothetical protein
MTGNENRPFVPGGGSRLRAAGRRHQQAAERAATRNRMRSASRHRTLAQPVLAVERVPAGFNPDSVRGRPGAGQRSSKTDWHAPEIK